jgi:CheY-like chemotaxis protein
MKLRKFKSIRGHLTYWFLLISLLPLTTTLVITYYQRVQVIESTAVSKLTAIRDLKVSRLNDWLNERKGDMMSISNDNEFKVLELDFSKNEYTDMEMGVLDNTRQILSRYLTNYHSYREFFILNPLNGEVLVSTNSTSEGRNHSAKDFFMMPMNSRTLYIKDIYYSELLSDYTLTYSMPIFCNKHEGKDIVGILVARIDLQKSLYPMLLHRVGLGETGETLIVNKDGLALNELRWSENAPLKLQISAEPVLRATRGETGIAETKDYRGVPVLAAFTFIPEMNWGFICKQDTYEINAPIREILLNFAVIFIISLFAILFVALFVSNSISKPVVALNKAAQKIGAGDFSIRNQINSADELGSLAHEFNKMAELTESRIKINKGISDISETMIGRSGIQEFGKSLLRRLMKITDANMSTFYILNEASMEYEHFASVGANEDMLKPFSAMNPQGEFGNVLSTKNIFHLQNIPTDTIFRFNTVVGEAIPKEIITIPIIVEESTIAIISLVNIQKFSKDSLEILQHSWVSINTSYSNLIANERTRILAEHLGRINQQLEAQSEELQDQAEELQDQAAELQQNSEELLEQNIELDAQRKQVESANKLKSEFLSNMSHELRTPLNSIMALSRVLMLQASKKLSEEENNYLEIVERNGKRLLALINDILDLSKIEAGKIEIEPKPFSLSSFLTIIKENMQGLAEQKGLSLSLNIPDGINQIETDELRLHQVLTNIVGNAVKFTDKGTVAIVVRHNLEHTFIEVKDSGIGIAAEELPYIFDEFRQVDGTSSRHYEGTGLGLAIARKMMNILGGEIKAESELGKGSIFTITIPIKWHEEFQISQSSQFENTNISSGQNTILVVDDDPKTVKLISEYLLEAGYKTITTTSGKEALKLAEFHQPFAITLDIIMEDMDGWEVLQKLKSNLRTQDIPVIVVSVSDDRDTGIALGAVGFINKPVNKHILISQIKEIIKLPDSVMIVDDNEFELTQISKIIESQNIKPILASGGKECLKLLEVKNPDILILDLMMPGMDGFTVLEEIRKKKETQNLPVIIVTAKDLNKEEKSRLSGNVSALITKSQVNPENLLREIKRIIMELERTKKIHISENQDPTTRILLVEDNPEAIIQVKTVLEKEHYTVDVASGGRQALDYMKYNHPDGIILDLMMPDIDGFEVLEQLRATEKSKKTPVLILTAKDLTRKLSANHIQQLIHKGDVDIDGLIYKVKLMLGNEPKLSSSKLQVSSSKEKENLKPETYTLSARPERSRREVEVQNLKPETSNLKLTTDLLNILIVEDNLDNMTTIKAILKGKYNITEALDGEIGLMKAQSEKPDLILLDMSLPKVSGTKVIKMLKADNETKNIPLIAVTAQAMKGDKENFLKSGCDGYVSKPIDHLELIAEIGRLLSR